MGVTAVMGLAFCALGLFAFAISGPLSTLVSNWNIFLRAEDIPAYRAKKLRRIRILATVWLVVGCGVLLVAAVGWLAELV